MQNSDKESGFLIINKPLGITSHDAVDALRRITKIKKIGHAGTLDPFAGGVLVMAIGREATKRISEFVKLDKEYIALLRLGAKTDTYDREGKIEINKDFKNKEVKLNIVKDVLNNFKGEQEQVPPMFSAKKIKGKKLYELARAGVEVERNPAIINIYSLELLEYKWPFLKLKVKCSSGTYIRSLANDIGENLGCSAYLEELERTAVGDFRIESSLDLKNVNGSNWRSFLQ